MGRPLIDVYVYNLIYGFQFSGHDAKMLWGVASWKRITATAWIFGVFRSWRLPPLADNLSLERCAWFANAPTHRIWNICRPAVRPHWPNPEGRPESGKTMTVGGSRFEFRIASVAALDASPAFQIHR